MDDAEPWRSLQAPAATATVVRSDLNPWCFPRLWQFLALACLGAGSFTGCGDPAAIRPSDIRVYSGPKPSLAEPQQEARPTNPLAYEAPADWIDKGPSGMRLTTLVVDGDHEITVIPASGTLRANVDRWLGQLDPSATPEQIDHRAEEALAAAETLAAGEAEASVVLLLPATGSDGSKQDGKAILGAMITTGESAALFVKLTGPAAVARRELENFRRFVSSIRWKPSDLRETPN